MSDTISRRECPNGHGRTVGWDPCAACSASSVERTYVAVDALLSDHAVACASAPWLMSDDDMRDAMQRAVEAAGR